MKKKSMMKTKFPNKHVVILKSTQLNHIQRSSIWKLFHFELHRKALRLSYLSFTSWWLNIQGNINNEPSTTPKCFVSSWSWSSSSWSWSIKVPLLWDAPKVHLKKHIGVMLKCSHFYNEAKNETRLNLHLRNHAKFKCPHCEYKAMCA